MVGDSGHAANGRFGEAADAFIFTGHIGFRGQKTEGRRQKTEDRRQRSLRRFAPGDGKTGRSGSGVGECSFRG
ncbi:MAG: hypothetical protein LBD06_13170 [Candidatus Accumulibacter sp.]|nr:hypothetical protein [Accumulibacter sp.]